MSRLSALSDDLRAQLLRQLAILERAGVAPLQALAALDLPEPANARSQRTLQLVSSGHSLSAAGRLAGLLTPLEAAVIGTASAGGSPAEAMHRLAERAATRAARAKQIRTRLLLPGFLLFAALVLLPLPALVSGSLDAASYLTRIVFTAIAVAVLWKGGRELYRRQAAAENWPGRYLAEWLLLRLPLLGPLAARVQAQRFLEHLALLLDCGLPAVEAVRVAATTLRLQCIREDFEAALPALAAGGSLLAAAEGWQFADDPRLPGLISVGEGSGRLPELLQRHARAEAAAIDARLEGLATWLPRLVYVGFTLWLASSLIGGFGALLRRSIE